MRKSKVGLQVKYMKADFSLFARLYIASSSRENDINEFFQHENQPFPPSLSEFGKLRYAKKSDIVTCLVSANKSPGTFDAPAVDAKILEGSVIVHQLKPKAGTNFGQYAADVFCPYIMKQFDNCTRRIDVVFDTYKADSLKEATRLKRGKTDYRSLIGSRTPTPPKNWENFLQNDDNKTQLFAFLAAEIVNAAQQKCVVVNSCSTVASSIALPKLSELLPTNHEEGDTKVILHAFHQAASNAKSIIIRTVDSDVIVLAVSFFHSLAAMCVKELFVAFGLGRSFRYINIGEIATSIGQPRSDGLRFFNAFTGCDTVSAFAFHGKTSAWNTWDMVSRITETFVKLGTPGHIMSDLDLVALEQFVIIMYDKTSKHIDVNKLRKHLFSKSSTAMDRLPPTREALRQHALRACIQSQLWSSSNIPMLPELDASKFGWHRVDEHWLPYWSNLPEAAASCRELIRCGCKTVCSGRCSCVKAELNCTELCGCKGSCSSLE